MPMLPASKAVGGFGCSDQAVCFFDDLGGVGFGHDDGIRSAGQHRRQVVFRALGVKGIDAHQPFRAAKIHGFQSFKDGAAGFVFAVGGHAVFKVEDHAVHIQAGGFGDLLQVVTGYI